jgi:hypothetical protein
MRTITIQKEVFKFEELSDRAKDEVRHWLSDWDDFGPASTRTLSAWQKSWASRSTPARSS